MAGKQDKKVPEVETTDIKKMLYSPKDFIPKEHFVIDDEDVGERLFVRKSDGGYEERTKDNKLNPKYPKVPKAFTLNDRDSFVNAVSRYGNKEEGAVLYDDDGLTFYLSAENQKERISLPFKSSLERRHFIGSAPDGKMLFDQKELVELLESFPDVVQYDTLLPLVERIKISTLVESESNVTEGDTILMYKVKDVSETVELPKMFDLKLPFFEGEEESTLPARFRVVMPKDEGRPQFELRYPTLERVLSEARKELVSKISSELSDFIFLNGCSK